LAVPDPLDALRTPITPIAPDPAFAARLRRRIERLVTTRQEEEQMTDVLLRDRVSRNGTRHGDVSYITLALPDAAKGRHFYAGVLGWTFAPGQVDTEGNQVDAVIPQLGLWPGSAWRDGVASGAICSWRVDDISVAVAAVRAAGGTADEPAERPYGLEAECTDGNGLRFWLHQLPRPGLPAGSNGDRHGDISYVVLTVGDLERAEAFFSSVLGWSFSPGNAGVNVVGPTPMTGMSEGKPGVLLCYRVDDLDAAVDRVRGAGGVPGAIESRPYGLESRCRDDQGVEFYLHQF
jgi:predicted enzyme related to lactoylglutathione lyase